MDPYDLYGLPLGRFIEDRNALAKRLRQERRREEASEVAKLPKPSVAAWAVNQLVRTHRPEMDALFDVGDALGDAQAELLAGRGDRTALRAAVDAERSALDKLNEAARELLSVGGHEPTAARLERVSETLQAAALDNEARLRVQNGCLHRELRHVGLGALAPADPGSGGGAGSEGTPSPTSRRGGPDRDLEAKAHTAKRKAARSSEKDARRQSERAARAAEVATRRRDAAARALQEAEQTLVRARGVAEAAALEHRRARAGLDEL